MSRKFKYVGPFEEVEIAATGQVVERGHQVEIEDPEVSKGLEGQADWAPVVQSKPRKRAAKKMTAKKPEPSTDDNGGDAEKSED